MCLFFCKINALVHNKTKTYKKQKYNLRKRNLEQIDAVVKSSLDYAKDSTHLEKVEVELVSFFEKILEIYRDKKAKAKLDVRFYCEEREIFAFIEIALMRRLLMNLIENAEKYASLVEIRLRRDVVKSRVILEVQDNGPGVPEQSLLKMGSPYYRVDQSRSRTTGGTGLGLAIVKKISALHGGKVEFENRLPELGGGLCVRVFINLKF
jgi:signal transduction histidine kinase